MTFRGKQIATLTLVAAAVALATSIVNLTSLARLTVGEARSRAELLAETLYHQTSRVIRQQTREEITGSLTEDPSLTHFAEGVVGYSPTIMYVAITDRTETALVHSNPRERGQKLTPAPSLDDFADENPLAQLWALSQGHRVLETSTPFDVDGQPFGSVRVAISTLLLKEEIAGAITRNVFVATGVVVAAFLLSLFFAAWLLAPIEMLRRELGRIRPGDGEPPLDLRNEADVSRIAEFFASVSQQLAEERSAKVGDSSWLSTMLGGLDDAVVVVSSDGLMLSLNSPAEALLGRKREDLQGKSLSDLLGSDHPVAEIVGKAQSEGKPVGPVHVQIDNGDHAITYVLTAQVLRDASGIFGVMVSARDMEKLSRLSSQLSYSQKLSALGKLTSGVAHEIKNPLNAMVIHVALLRERLARAGPDTQASLDTLDQEIHRLDRVIQGFLRFTRPEDLQLTAVPLEELLGEVVRLVSAEAKASGIEVETQIGDELPFVYGDRELLQQVFVNLVRNACEAMPEGGKLKLEAGKGDEGVLVEVSDRGIGIPPDKLGQIFDLYMTTKSGGSGIGLSMVYRIVQLHGGEITVESQMGEGSTFTVLLPGVQG